jgi:hypothetical protein
MLIIALFTIAKYRIGIRAHGWISGYRKGGIYTQWSFTQPLRRAKLCCLMENGWNWGSLC